MDHRSILQSLAAQAVEDPAHASAYARVVLEQIERWRSEGGAVEPPGYLYAGARTIVIQAQRLEPEGLPEESAAFGGGPNAVPITKTRNEYVTAKMPVDVLLYGVAGFCVPDVLRDNEGDPLAQPPELASLFSTARDCRDLFAASWNVDGETSFVTDGDGPLLTPAAALVGTREKPRPIAWRLQRDQTIGVKFRNITNAIVSRSEAGGFPFSITITCGLVFYGVNLERVRS